MCLDLLISSGNLGIVTAAKRLLHQNMFFSHRASPTTEGKSSFSQTNISKLPHFLLGILSWVESIGFPHLPWVFVRILRILPLSEDLLLLFYYFQVTLPLVDLIEKSMIRMELSQRGKFHSLFQAGFPCGMLVLSKTLEKVFSYSEQSLNPTCVPPFLYVYCVLCYCSFFTFFKEKCLIVIKNPSHSFVVLFGSDLISVFRLQHP